MKTRILCLLFVALSACSTPASFDGIDFPLDTIDGIDARGVTVEPALHRGKRGVRVVEKSQGAADAVAILPISDFRDGTIEIELSGEPRSDAAPNMRGFVGVAFRIQDESPLRYECIYLRPTNGRADDQLRRNHSTQYVSHPDFTWRRLRDESPGVYESYVDIVPGEWTAVRIVVDWERAELFVSRSDQPALIVPNLKGPLGSGAVGLWIGDGTEAYFRDLKISALP